MINYDKKYYEYTQGLLKCISDISKEYPECNGFEKCVISMRKQGWTYGDIQSKLGMPSKKQIRSVLLKWAPELIDNSKTKIIDVSNYESELYNMIRKNGSSIFKIDGEDWEFYIKDNKLWCNDCFGDDMLFNDYDKATQSQILNQIKEQINEC